MAENWSSWPVLCSKESRDSPFMLLYRKRERVHCDTVEVKCCYLT